MEKIIKNIDKYFNKNKKQKIKNELKNINQQFNLIIKEKENDNKQIELLKKELNEYNQINIKKEKGEYLEGKYIGYILNNKKEFTGYIVYKNSETYESLF